MGKNEDVAAEIIRLRQEGLGIKHIARAVAKGNGFVVKTLKDHGAEGRPYFLTDDEKATVKRLRLEGHSHEVIADSIGRSKYAVIEHLTKLKLNDRIIRPITIRGDIAEIKLTREKVAIIDATDVGLVQGKSWFTTGPKTHSYAATRLDGNIHYLHRYLMAATPDKVVDHINGDTLDNRRGNLRLATNRENTANSRRKENTSGALGVTVMKSGRFYAAISFGIGAFDTLEEAARAYDAKATELFGDFAMTNAKKGLFDKKS